LSDQSNVNSTFQSVGLYPTNSMTVNKFILEDSRTNIVVVEEAKNVEKLLEVKNELPDLKKIVQYDGTTVAHPGTFLVFNEQSSYVMIKSN
jgi:long-subunit acyl-CoA synthetase (AMP-forming)